MVAVVVVVRTRRGVVGVNEVRELGKGGEVSGGEGVGRWEL